MFQQQARGNGPPGMPGQPPQAQPQQPPALIQCQSDVQAKEKLTTLIYEYLTMTGATKTAEAFKEEVLNPNPSLANFKPAEKGSSFLVDWWTIFWDLYCAAPERRDMSEGAYTTEAKYFHDSIIGPVQPPMMNGHQFGHPMGLGGPDMMGPFGRFGGRMPPAGMPPAGFGMFQGDPRMARIPPGQMRMGAGSSFPGAPPGAMRPGPGGQMPGMPRFNDFMACPPGSAFPGASGSGMMPNGTGIPPMSMSSPGMPPPPGSAEAIAAGQPPFMGMPGASSASAMPPFGMDPIATSAASSTAPGSVPPGSVPATSSATDTPPAGSAATPGGTATGGPGSVGPSSSGGCGTGGGATAGNGNIPSVGAAPTSLVNGDDIKSSPVSTPMGGNGTVAGAGTPAPGSAQSIGMQPGTPVGGPGSHPPLSAGASTADFKDDSEISKIKEGLLDGFMKTEGSEAPFYA